MAEIQVTDEQGNVHIFPDGSTPEMMAKVLNVKAPSQHDYSSLTANPKGEGTYKIKAPDGQTVEVPYSNVPVFTKGLQGASFASPEEQSRFDKDAAADPKRPTFWNALTNPVGGGGRTQGFDTQFQDPAHALASGVPGGALQFGGQVVKTMAQPFAHPVDTAVGTYNLVRHPIAAAQGVVQNFKNDVSSGGLPLALENAAGQAVGAVEGGRVMAPVTQAAMTAAPRLIGRAALLGNTPEGAYGSALKGMTGKATSIAKRDAIIQTGLENAIPMSKGGLEKLGDLIDDLDQKKTDVIAQDPTRPIDPNAVATRADAAKAKFANQVNAGGDLNAIEASRQQFLREQGAPVDAQGNVTGPAPDMNAIDAQAMKQGTYNVLRGKYGEQGSAAVEAQKALARGLKEEIATQFPELSGLNAAESRLLDLQPVLENAVKRISNHQAVGLGTPAAGVAAQAVTGSTTIGKVAMVMKAILDQPNIKSRLAIAVSKANKMSYPAALARVQSYAASFGSAVPDSQAYSSGGTPTPAANPAP